MAWYDANRKEGFNGIAYPGYKPSSLFDGREALVGGYSATHYSQSYETKSEQFVGFRRFPAIGDRKNSPTKKEFYKDHGEGHKPILVPWNSARDQPEKARDFSPKFGNQLIHGQSKGSPRANANHSPQSRDHHPFYTNHDDYGKHKNKLSSDDEGDDDDDDDDDEDEDEDEDDVICHDGVCYKNNKGGAKPNHFKDDHQGNYVDKEKHKLGNGYVPPSYTVQPIEKYYEPSYPNNHTNNDHNKHIGNHGYAPPSYTVPVSTPPIKDTTYHDINRPLLSNPPPPIKTRSDARNSPAYVAAKQPQISSSPNKKDHQGYNNNNNKETIDSSEARRRYGQASPRAGAHVAEENYARTIDSREAARKYKGVFVPTKV